MRMGLVHMGTGCGIGVRGGARGGASMAVAMAMAMAMKAKVGGCRRLSTVTSTTTRLPGAVLVGHNVMGRRGFSSTTLRWEKEEKGEKGQFFATENTTYPPQLSEEDRVRAAREDAETTFMAGGGGSYPPQVERDEEVGRETVLPSKPTTTSHSSPSTTPSPSTTTTLSTTTSSTTKSKTLEFPSFLDTTEREIFQLLATSDLAPTKLDIKDVSGGCGSMFAIEVESEVFRGLGLLKQQRAVMAVLGGMVRGWHGVQVRTKVPVVVVG